MLLQFNIQYIVHKCRKLLMFSHHQCVLISENFWASFEEIQQRNKNTNTHI